MQMATTCVVCLPSAMDINTDVTMDAAADMDEEAGAEMNVTTVGGKKFATNCIQRAGAKHCVDKACSDSSQHPKQRGAA